LQGWRYCVYTLSGLKIAVASGMRPRWLQCFYQQPSIEGHMSMEMIAVILAFTAFIVIADRFMR
jgi:hypothetical protein